MTARRPPDSPPPADLRSAQDAAVDAFDELDGAWFDVMDLRRVLASLADTPDKPALSRAFVQVYLEARLIDMDNVELPAGFATLMILAVGQTALHGAIAAELKATFDPRAKSALWVLAELAGMQVETFSLPALRLSKRDAAPWLRTISQDPNQLVARLLLEPVAVCAASVETLLSLDPPPLKLVAFAGQLLLTPMDAATQAQVRGWLERHGGAAGAWLLAYEAGERRDGSGPWPELPLTWPVTEAFASFPDGEGTQRVYLVRRHAGRKRAFALVDASLNDGLGTVQATALSPLTQLELDAALAEAREEVALTPVPAAYVSARLAAGVALRESLGLPLPMSYRLNAPLLQGLPVAVPLDLEALAAGWAEPARLAETGALASQAFFGYWYLVPGDAAELPAFFEASDPIVAAGAPTAPVAMQQLDALIADWTPRIFGETLRGTLCQRLRHVAYLFDCQQAPGARDLAATAAWALDPASAVPLAEQPLLRQMLVYSARVHAAASTAQPDDDGAADAREPTPVFQLEIRLPSRRAPAWRRLLIPGRFSLGDLHDAIQTAFGWDDDHVHVFTIDEEEYGSAPAGFDVGLPHDYEVTLAEVLREGLAFTYEYDFVAGFKLAITVERSFAPEAGARYPTCSAGAGAGPEQRQTGFDLDAVRRAIERQGSL